MVRRRGLAA
ncbi:hypothetical protein E2C01_087344 [Portunus trituberculatus]|uniref:Uncharacterized protein n=1 Tax=Portunus trituberculatus TaxID=210409 RepID=A0A5B7JDT3_PORTR|nr:hypothetical protein [Portunus trituberculatus]